MTTTVDSPRPLAAPGAFHRGALVLGDLLGAVGLVLLIPFVIIAIGIPIALCVKLLLWLVRML